MDTDNEITDATPLVDFANKVEDKSKNIIKVVGVGGGGCNEAEPEPVPPRSSQA